MDNVVSLVDLLFPSFPESCSSMEQACADVGLCSFWLGYYRERRSAATFAVPGRITNLYGNAEISQLHLLSRSIVDFDALTLVVEESNMYLRLL